MSFPSTSTRNWERSGMRGVKFGPTKSQAETDDDSFLLVLMSVSSSMVGERIRRKCSPTCGKASEFVPIHPKSCACTKAENIPRRAIRQKLLVTVPKLRSGEKESSAVRHETLGLTPRGTSE